MNLENQTTPQPSELTNFQKIEIEAKKICPEFRIETESDEALYNSMILYFTGNEKSPWDVNKGLLLMGDVGTGKTMCMRVMSKIFKSFQMVRTRHITRDAIDKPNKTIDTYGRKSFRVNAVGHLVRENPFAYCFDDLGLEPSTINNFGNKSNVMAEILLDRYEMYVEYGMITHCTTNIDANKIGELYGERVKDRLRQMMNLIVMEGRSKRK